MNYVNELVFYCTTLLIYYAIQNNTFKPRPALLLVVLTAILFGLLYKTDYHTIPIISIGAVLAILYYDFNIIKNQYKNISYILLFIGISFIVNFQSVKFTFMS